MKKILVSIFILALLLTGCSGANSGRPLSPEPEKETAPSKIPNETTGYNWLIQVTDSKKSTYSIPMSNKSIDFTVTLHFIAWKNSGEDMFGNYKGRALITFDTDYSKLSDEDVMVSGAVMKDNICDNISFEITPYKKDDAEANSSSSDIELAPLVTFIGQSDFITDEYTIKQETWTAMGDGKTLLDVNDSFSEEMRHSQGFIVKADKDTVIISVPTYNQTYSLDYFRGTISANKDDMKPLDLFRDTVTTRMEERLEMSENANTKQNTDSNSQTEGETSGSFMTDNEGREGFDTDGDGKMDIWIDEDGNARMDLDKDGKWDPVIESDWGDGALD